MRTNRSWLALAMLCFSAPMFADDFRAGSARVKITPEVPMWLTGFAARTHAATGVKQDLWAKALALEDGSGGRVVVVTTDLLGLPREVSDEVARRCEKQFSLKRAQLWLNSSHTHSGPIVWPLAPAMFELNAEDTAHTKAYAEELKDQLTQIVGESLSNLSPAKISYGTGEAGFAINRRATRFHDLNPAGDPRSPTDHRVPVLLVSAPDGTPRVVLFGYACHNTTLTAEFYDVSGDYAGYAQAALEQEHPGVQAMFFLLCAADQNPAPRGNLEYAEKHGKDLAAAVDTTLKGAMKALEPPIRTAYLMTNLQFAPHTRAQFEEEAKDKNVFKVRRAKLMLESYDSGKPMRSIEYPVQAIRFGKGLAIVTLGGEVVVDYALRARREYPNTDLVVAGYSNVVMSYIPSLRVLREGGYEANDAMIYYGRPGPYTEDVEEKIFKTIHRALSKVGVSRP